MYYFALHKNANLSVGKCNPAKCTLKLSACEFEFWTSVISLRGHSLTQIAQHGRKKSLFGLSPGKVSGVGVAERRHSTPVYLYSTISLTCLKESQADCGTLILLFALALFLSTLTPVIGCFSPMKSILQFLWELKDRRPIIIPYMSYEHSNQSCSQFRGRWAGRHESCTRDIWWDLQHYKLQTPP